LAAATTPAPNAASLQLALTSEIVATLTRFGFFLTLTSNEYAAIATENRLQPSQWLSLIEKYGFEILDRCEQVWQADGTLYLHLRPGEAFEPMVDEQMRAEFTEPFVTWTLLTFR
jgi:hypothetical protein